MCRKVYINEWGRLVIGKEETSYCPNSMKQWGYAKRRETVGFFKVSERKTLKSFN
jgi:hypothetical protein